MTKKEAETKAFKILSIIDFNAKYSKNMKEFRGKYLSEQAMQHIIDILLRNTAEIPYKINLSKHNEQKNETKSKNSDRK